MGRIIGTINLKKFDKAFKLLETHEQPMRSWTRGLIENLYVLSAQIGQPSPMASIGDMDNTPRSVYLPTGGGTQRWATDHGYIAAPGGFSHLGVNYSSAQMGGPQGCDVGIQVGTVNTVATPSDTRLGQRIGHGTRPADAGDVEFEFFDTGDTSQNNISGNYPNQQLAQPFTPTHDFRCTSVAIKAYKTGNPSAGLTVAIYADNWGLPAATAIASVIMPAGSFGGSPGAFITCTFTTPATGIDLYAGHRYYIVIHSTGVDGSNYYSWRWNTTGSTISYDRADDFQANDNVNCYTAYISSGSWYSQGYGNTIYMFRTYGMSIGEMEYGGTEIVNRVTANPNDAFDIRRFFYNRSGASIAVAEIGINSMYYYWNPNYGFKIVPMLIAHDAPIGPVAVNNGQYLLVTYTPQITV